MSTKLSNGGLPAHAVARMRSVFSAHPGIEQVVLFGSRAKGNYKPASDIDLAVLGTVDSSEIARIDWELDDLLLPWEIDLLQFDQLNNPDLREHIARVGQPLFLRSPEHAL
jgi:predicted nucleotidyltransferase